MICSMKTKGPKSIFISRSLRPNSLFHKLSQAGHKLIDESLIQFSEVEFQSPKNYDSVFFYSQKAIEIFLKKYAYDPHKEYGVMGPSSQAMFSELTGRKPQLVGDGNQKKLANMIVTEWAHKTILFPQADNSLNSLDPLLKKVSTINLIVYSNLPKKNVTVPSCDIYLFTSPLNATTFYANNSTGSAVVYAIGETTAGQIKQLTGQTVLYCSQPSVENLYYLTLTKL